MMLTNLPSAAVHSRAHLTMFFSSQNPSGVPIALNLIKSPSLGTQFLHELLPAYPPNLVSHSFLH